jgi:hypothetical protein
MKKPAVNPYLPAWEYVPDGEPHVFGDRVYVFGSHDEDGGDEFCLNDYVGWSAPVDDLGNWRYEGVIYRKDQDPLQHSKDIFTPPNRVGQPHLLFAPDVAQGRDGRYYLYYSVDFSNIISVAVCDTPAGAYEFYGHVKMADGSCPQDLQWFDPAILVDEAGIFLYVGSAPEVHFPTMPDEPIPGGRVMELAEDMLTVISQPECTARGVETAKGTEYEAHPFFEGSSIRHFGDWYYFVYSSLQGHELCYAMSRSPMGPFSYRGVLVSNGDLGRNGNTVPQYYLGNNHGGLVQIGEKYYIFGHRHTHGGQFSRQGFAEEVHMAADGTFDQAELTSCGLNNGPLPALGGEYRASIACCLMGPNRARMLEQLPLMPNNTPESDIPYVSGGQEEGQPENYRSWLENLRPGAAFGYKYFDFQTGVCGITVTARGIATLTIHLDGEQGPVLGQMTFASGNWTENTLAFAPQTGVHSVYFTVEGPEGARLDCSHFQFH